MQHLGQKCCNKVCKNKAKIALDVAITFAHKISVYAAKAIDNEEKMW